MSLSNYSDQELRDELKRRAAERKAAKVVVPRCKTCVFCKPGHCQRTLRCSTLVCYAKPKPQCGEDRYYATSASNKACEMYKSKQ